MIRKHVSLIEQVNRFIGQHREKKELIGIILNVVSVHLHRILFSIQNNTVQRNVVDVIQICGSKINCERIAYSILKCLKQVWIIKNEQNIIATQIRRYRIKRMIPKRIVNEVAILILISSALSHNLLLPFALWLFCLPAYLLLLFPLEHQSKICRQIIPL